MAPEARLDLSVLLIAWAKGDKAALGQLVSLVYPELRRIARRHIAVRRPGQSLESAALANEAYLKFLRVEGVRCEIPTSLLFVPRSSAASWWITLAREGTRNEAATRCKFHWMKPHPPEFHSWGPPGLG
jgi:hypothetical protein